MGGPRAPSQQRCRTFPLIDTAAQRVNVSVELLDFQPMALDTVTSILDECGGETHLETITDVRAWLEE